jgi:hypothetical protein
VGVIDKLTLAALRAEMMEVADPPAVKGSGLGQRDDCDAGLNNRYSPCS